jgi:hypothetical protein
VLDALPQSEALEDTIFFADPVFRHDESNGTSDRLVSAVPVHPLGSVVPSGNGAVEGHPHDCVLGRFNDRRQFSADPLTVRPFTLGAAAVRDVAKHHHRASDAAVHCFHRRGAVVDRNFTSRSGDQQRMVRKSGDRAFAQHPFHRIRGRSPRVLVHDDEHVSERTSLSVLLRPAGQGLRDRVDLGDTSPLVGCDHRIAEAVNRHTQALF